MLTQNQISNVYVHWLSINEFKGLFIELGEYQDVPKIKFYVPNLRQTAIQSKKEEVICRLFAD